MKYPPPTADYQNPKEAWLERMHNSHPRINWRHVEYQNKLNHLKNRKNNGYKRASDFEHLANDRIFGMWEEKGSNNQAGRVLATLYIPETKEVYLISDGGSLWKGPIDGSEWKVVNDAFRFQYKSLHRSDVSGKIRLHSIINKIPHFSDDMGETWQAAQGTETFDNNWGTRDPLLAVNQGAFLSFKVQEWSPIPWHQEVGIYSSSDYGVSFKKIHSFGNIPHPSVVLTPATKQNMIFGLQVDKVTGQQHVFYFNALSDSITIASTSDTLSFGDEQVRLFVDDFRDSIRLFTYDVNLNWYRSDDMGTSWQKIGTLPAAPWLWAGAIFISPSNPDFMLLGEVNCHKSINGGQTWVKINDWEEYYDQVASKLHADMMHFNEVQLASGDLVHLISNDGGLSISYDGLETTQNIGTKNLNVSQYYDVRTDPLLPSYVYAASQDQGFQRSSESLDVGTLDFEQVIPGDYGHITFSHAGKSLWTVYPDGLVRFFENPRTGNSNAFWSIESEDESVWLPPMINHWDPQKILIAGGNINGGTGSHIIELTYGNNSISENQYPFDFKKDAGGEISALEVSPVNKNKWYAATTNGLFYYSIDGGQNWDVSVQVGPYPQYLYGTVIKASRFDENVVYFGGSGYSTFPIYRSDDGGRNFYPISEGLPPTLMVDLDFNADESLLFAACEAGPYVYFQDEGQWYSLLGDFTPMHTWFSIEYLTSQKIARFGTLGRGIWDLHLQEVFASEETYHDLFVSNMEVSEDLLIPGDTLNIRCDQHFTGRGDHRWLVFSGFYLSTDTVFDNSDLKLGSSFSNLNEQGVTVLQKTISIPEDVLEGKYYLIIVVDDIKANAEANESNNIAWKTLTIESESSFHDLYISDLSITSDPTNPGDSFLIHYEQIFEGRGDHQWLVFSGFYLSHDTLLDETDPKIGQTFKTINEQNTVGLDIKLIIPDSVDEGDYILLALIDDLHAYEEVDELNNFSWVSLTIASVTGFSDLISQKSIHLYPNPASEVVYLIGDINDFQHYQWISADGKILKQDNLEHPFLPVPEDVFGYYLLKLYEKNSPKFIVKQVVIK